MLTRLALTDMRNYAALVWQPPRLAALVGPNGAGKTNLLEAISQLVPGRGLRGARPAELARLGAPCWAVAGRFRTPFGETEIGAGTLPEAPDRRLFRVDGAATRSQAEIAERVVAVWLTPQMDRLFTDPASGRRRFLDRLVWALDGNHARELAAYERVMAERNRLLSLPRPDAAWLDALEEQMARHAVAVAAARRDLVARMNALDDTGAGGFPRVRLDLRDQTATAMDLEPARLVEETLRARLAAARRADAAAGGAGLGAHRADLDLVQAGSGVPAARSSTGEQRALLLATILAHARLIAGLRGFAPLLLLDEPAIHLDAARRAALLRALAGLPSQVFMTATDAAVFAPERDRIALFEVGAGTLTSAARVPLQGVP